MAGKILRGAIVGASTLLGEELAEELTAATTAVWDIGLLDTEDAGGTITPAGDEALLIHPISAESFIGVDVVFFAGEAATALQFWKAARAAGARIVDLTGALEGQPGVEVRSPLLGDAYAPDLVTVAAVSANPAAIMLALVSKQLRESGLERLAATVLQPASELGTAGVEEVHQQTVSLLSFKPLPKDIYDAQIAFNVVAGFGSSAKVNLQDTSNEIVRHIKLLTDSAAEPLTVQLLQVPVFHGYTASVFLEVSEQLDEETLRKILVGKRSHLIVEEFPSNEMIAGKGEILVRITKAQAKKGSAFWLWMAADNLRLAARNAVACALDLLKLKPISVVQ